MKFFVALILPAACWPTASKTETMSRSLSLNWELAGAVAAVRQPGESFRHRRTRRGDSAAMQTIALGMFLSQPPMATPSMPPQPTTKFLTAGDDFKGDERILHGFGREMPSRQ